MEKTTQETINSVLWSAADTFRGKIDSSTYKDYILVMLFVKYISDVHKERFEVYSERYDGNEERIERAMNRERFVLDEKSTFDHLYNERTNAEIGVIINKALGNMEDKNATKLRGVFRNIDFNSEAVLGATRDRNTILRNVLEDFHRLDLRPSKVEDEDIIGNAYQYMIEQFASDAGKKGGEFFTPPMVSELLARLVEPQENDRIYDPTCGSGSLLIRVVDKVSDRKVAIYGQERNGQTHSLAKMNMFLNNIDDARIEWGDTISNPLHLDDEGGLMKFQRIVANPPFSLAKWAEGFAGEGEERFRMQPELDPFRRFDWSVPPASRGDMAFVQHMLSSLAEGGTMATILPHGVLFRGAAEKRIREEFINMNYLHAVIGLPEALFYGTGITACILVFKKGRTEKDVLFIDASGEDHFEKGSNRNFLREEDIATIFDTYKNYETVDKYAYVASLDEIKENDYNLNIPRYVDTFEEEEEIDLMAVRAEREQLKAHLTELETEMAKYLEELGYGEIGRAACRERG